MILLDTTIVSTAMPAIMKSLDADISSILWVNSAYLLTFAVLLLVTGRLGDTFGPKPVFVAGLVVFTLASLACGLSGSIGLLIAARAVQGVGGDHGWGLRRAADDPRGPSACRPAAPRRQARPR